MLHCLIRISLLDHGPLPMPKIRLPARSESLEEFLEFVSGLAEERGLSERKIKEIELAIEEALVNIIHYAYPESAGEVEIHYRKNDDTNFILEILDNGVPFDPLSLSEPDLTGDVSDRKVGGLGVFFIREMTDKVRYRRNGETNALTLTFSK